MTRSPDRHAFRAYDTISAHNAEGSHFVPPLDELAEVDAMRRHDIAADARARLGASRARAARANAKRIIARAVQSDASSSCETPLGGDEARRGHIFFSSDRLS